jgi:pimeloyl-ACP methyl ester carboxylesterase
MTEPRLDFVHCLGAGGLRRMAYWQWGEPGNPRVVVCAHGLTRQGRDFDTLARALAADCRVICPDVAGRGESDWLADPMGYAVPTYVSDMVALLARLNVPQVDWVGTSMGGLIGLGLAALRDRRGASLVGRLLLNDVGPALGAAAIERIGSYVGAARRHASLDEAADYLWSISQGFGPHSREQWLALTRPQFREVDDHQGRGFIAHYDPRIALPFKAMRPEQAALAESILWQQYDSLDCPTLVIRGAQSDLLAPETARAMTERGPRARLVELPGIGHAPTLVADEQVARVREFLGLP